ncbi:MAG: DUF2240 family protein [Candidatus Helarchaeota archaeon]
MNLEATIKKLIEKTGLTRAELMKKINKKKEDLANLMTDVGAAYLIAKEYGIDIETHIPPRRPITQIKDINPNKTIVNVVGRINKIFNVRTFIRKKDNKEGRVGSFIIEDKTGQIRIVLWDNQTEIIETHQIEEGQPIYIENGMLKSGLNGLEIHIGNRGRLDSPPESLQELIPEKIDVYNINDLKEGLRGINIRGVITWKGELKVFERKSGEMGQVIPIILRDETGSIRCSIWGEKANSLENFNVEDTIRMDDVAVRKNNLGELEISANIDTIINRDSKKIHIRKSKGVEFKINELTHGSKNINIKFKVIEKEETRELVSRRGEELKVANFLVADETGCIILTAWNLDIEKVKTGKTYQLINGYINEFRGSLRLNIGKYGEIKELDEDLDNVNLNNNITNKPTNNSNHRKYIKDLKEGQFVQIRGSIVNIYEKNPIYESCPECMKKVSKNDDNTWNCPNCGTINEKVDRMIWSFVLDDGTENIKITVAGKVAQKLLGLDIISAKKIMERELFAEAPLKLKEIELLGKEIIVSGTPKINSFTNKLELFASNVVDADPLEESQLLLSQIQE